VPKKGGFNQKVNVDKEREALNLEHTIWANTVVAAGKVF
jgi:hypothetical protein